MKKIVLISLILIAANTAALETDEDKQRKAAYRAKIERIFANERRMEKTRPFRRESPFRSDNVTDQEVEEIQAAAAAIIPGAVVNIGTVVKGCPCEDGPLCSDQVWIVAYRPDKTTGFLLSRIRDHWVLGAVQRWWLDYENLYAQRGNYSSWRTWIEAEDAMILNYPRCDAQQTVPGEAPANRPPPLNLAPLGIT